MKFLVHTEDIEIPEGGTFNLWFYNLNFYEVTVEEKARKIIVRKGDLMRTREFKHVTFEIIDGMHKRLKKKCK